MELLPIVFAFGGLSPVFHRNATADWQKAAVLPMFRKLMSEANFSGSEMIFPPQACETHGRTF
jgi:hypothetical protein